MLKLIGYWHGDYDASEWPDPRLFIQPQWEVKEKPRIIAYLQRGIRIHEDLGYSHCRFPDGPPDEEMGNAELTDGTWIWPEGLWIYVLRYDVILPEEFVAHMRSNHFDIPDGLRAGQLEALPMDFGFWRSWCATRAPKRQTEFR